jgi:uncharacterized peroxidase-related enzyme
MISWIETIAYEESDGELRALYEQVKTPHGTVDNVMKAHSLRPHTMAGHLALYKSVLHNPHNTLPLWFLETVASYTSLINACAYSFAHHFNNVRKLVDDHGRAEAIERALRAGTPETVFAGKELALLRYTAKLTAEPGAMAEADIAALRAAGASDGEILEVNQVCAYFSYSNRLLNGLGVTTQGDVIGYYGADEKE